MGNFLDKPNTEKYNEHGDGNGLHFGVASMQGWRVEMEDAHHVRTGLGKGLEDWSFFAVFDGHAGATVSTHCAEQLLESIINSEEFKQSEISEAIRSGFLKLDDAMRTKPEFACGQDKAGSTAVCALVSPKQVYIANCGDSRAVICRRGKPDFCTQDHKPILPAEKERIQNAGGTVMIQRVNGSLAVSRALGDYEYKNVQGRGPCEQLVSPEPEVFIQDRDEENDEFMVLACDGIWDVMTNEEVCDYIRSLLLLSDDLEAITNQVIDTCLYKGSRDNMSIVLVTFPGAPRPSLEAIRKDDALNADLDKVVREVLRINRDMDFDELLRVISSLPNFPPGGGVSAKSPEECRKFGGLMSIVSLNRFRRISGLKPILSLNRRSFIESIYKELCPQQADSVCMYP